MPFVPYDRVRGSKWQIWQNPNGTFATEQVVHALLMDIREELRTLNRVFACHNFRGMPESLRQIQRNTNRAYQRKLIRQRTTRTAKST